MIELHLKDGRVLTCDAKAEDARFVQGESSRRLEKKIMGDFVTVAEVHIDAYAFLVVTDHVTLQAAQPNGTDSGYGLPPDAGE